MVDLSETSVFNPVTRIESTTVALGGDEVNSPNLQLKQLVDRDKWLRDQIEAITGAGSINTLALDVEQIAHGFNAKDPVYHNGANWLKSDAGSSATAIATAIVSNVIDTDNFTLTLAGRITGLTGLTGGRVYYLANGGGIALTPGTIQRPVLLAESAAVGYFAPLYDFPTVESANVAQGRLTFTAGTPIMTSNVLAATSLYYTPHIGDKITLWNSTRGHWQQYTFTQRTLSLAGLAANTNFDVFIYDNAGTLTLEAVAWSNSGAGTSARDSALTYKDGVRVKASDNRKYLGCFRTTGTIGQSEFSPTVLNNNKVYLWNEYSKVPIRVFSQLETSSTTWSYSGVVRPANNNTAYRLSFLSGSHYNVPAHCVADLQGAPSPVGNASGQFTLLGLNSTTVSYELYSAEGGDTTPDTSIVISQTLDLPLGYSFVQLLESGGSSTRSIANGVSMMESQWSY